MTAIISQLNAMGTQNLLTLALVAITALYVILTGRLARSAAKQVELITRPRISAAFLIDEGNSVYLRIQNTGATGAERVRLRLDRNVVLERGNLGETDLFRHGTAWMPPGSVHDYAVGTGPDVLAEQAEAGPFTITAEYVFGKKRYLEEHILDFAAFSGSLAPRYSAEAQALRELNKRMGQLTKEVAALQQTIAGLRKGELTK